MDEQFVLSRVEAFALRDFLVAILQAYKMDGLKLALKTARKAKGFDSEQVIVLTTVVYGMFGNLDKWAQKTAKYTNVFKAQQELDDYLKKLECGE